MSGPWATTARRTLAAVAVGLGAMLALAAPAAADAQDVVTAFDETITLDAHGTAHVVIDLTMDFGSSPNHGPYLTYPVKRHYDATYDRIFRFSHIRAQSSDAPAGVDVQDENGWNQIRIGDPDRTVTGSHTYRISYDVDGWVNPADYPFPSGPLDHDELYLNVIGDRWTMPLDNVNVTVVGPAAVTDATCYTGPTGSTTRCDAVSADGAGVTYHQQRLSAREPLSVVVAWPAGTFDTAPILQEVWTPERAFAVNPSTGATTGLLTLAGFALVFLRVRRRGRDREYLGLTPGLAPAPGQEAAIGPRRRAAISVQFTPPPDVRPGQLGTLVDEHADVRDVTATIVDLAVRGYLRDRAGRRAGRARARPGLAPGADRQARRRPARLRAPVADRDLRRRLGRPALRPAHDVRVLAGPRAEPALRGRHRPRLVHRQPALGARPMGRGGPRPGGAGRGPDRAAGGPHALGPGGPAGDRGRASGGSRLPGGARADGGRHRCARPDRGLPALPGYCRGRSAALRGGRGPVQQVPAVRGGVRPDRAVDPGLHRARSARASRCPSPPGTSARGATAASGRARAPSSAT